MDRQQGEHARRAALPAVLRAAPVRQQLVAIQQGAGGAAGGRRPDGPAGRAAVEAAHKDGTWTALDEVENLVEPDDLRAALDAEPRARAEWDAFPRSARRGILEWILSAKRPETRRKRVEETAGLAAEAIRANQWPRAKRS